MKPLPSEQASINKRIILYVLNRIRIPEEWKQYIEFRKTALPLNKPAEKEDYGLTIPSGKGKVEELDLLKAKRQYTEKRKQLLAEFKTKEQIAQETKVLRQLILGADSY